MPNWSLVIHCVIYNPQGAVIGVSQLVASLGEYDSPPSPRVSIINQMRQTIAAEYKTDVSRVFVTWSAVVVWDKAWEGLT